MTRLPFVGHEIDRLENKIFIAKEAEMLARPGVVLDQNTLLKRRSKDSSVDVEGNHIAKELSIV